MKLNQRLGVVAAMLLIASVWTYQASVSRSQRFERGQRFLPNLNPDDAAAIVLSSGDETVTLERGDDGFTVAEVDGYPASNTAVNRVLRSLVDRILPSAADVDPAAVVFRNTSVTVVEGPPWSTVLVGCAAHLDGDLLADGAAA